MAAEKLKTIIDLEAFSTEHQRIELIDGDIVKCTRKNTGSDLKRRCRKSKIPSASPFSKGSALQPK